ncbi:NADP-dependent malic enzyme [Ectothiorhodospiraceae bacterium BW-2]|nr:NADP-dependent malic enzyme [Ectothiorhodospiraceae bacterium BW-2]
MQRQEFWPIGDRIGYHKRPLRLIERFERCDMEQDEVFQRHLGGKIEMVSKVAIESEALLRQIYTPGVAKVCQAIAADPALVRRYTNIGNSVAIVTDGSAILGLGPIGALAGLPVMEGKAAILSQFAAISCQPILFQSSEPKVIIDSVAAIATSFGAILLEDIAAPNCFEIEAELQRRLDIPVFHDDQHGTAVVVLSVLLKAAKLHGIDLQQATFGQIGLGAAGIGICSLLLAYGMPKVLGSDINPAATARLESLGGEGATLEQVMARADIVVTTTGVKGLIKPEWVRAGQIILSLTNPDPEIEPEVALAHGALVALDGKSVNNMLAFPGLFRGALDAEASHISQAMKIAAAVRLAELAPDRALVANGIDKTLHQQVAAAVFDAAKVTN